MSIELYLAFVLAASVLILIPGPNVTLIVANSLTYGARFAFTTIAGTTLAQIVQLSLTVAGMTAAMSAMAGWFDWLRWLGVAYLFCLGIRMWRSAPERMVDGAASSRRAGRLFWQGFLVSLTNPKTLLFYAAFLPQFVNPAVAPMPQFALLSLTLLVVSLLVVSLTFDSSYCLLAGRIRPWFRGAAVERLRNKVTGTLLVASGVGLALARRS